MSLSQVETKVQEITRNSKVLNVGIWEEESEEDRPWEIQQIEFDEEQNRYVHCLRRLILFYLI